MRMLPTARSACAETFIRNAELGRWSGKWDLVRALVFACCYDRPAGTTVIKSTSASPLLPPARKCTACYNPGCRVWAGYPFKLKTRSTDLILSASLILLMHLFCAPLGYFVLIRFQSFIQPLGHTASEKPFKWNQPCSKLSSLTQTITQDSYKCLSKHFHILHFLLSN